MYCIKYTVWCCRVTEERSIIIIIIIIIVIIIIIIIIIQDTHFTDKVFSGVL